MKTIVVYKSKTGFTKQYAEWISEQLNCTAIPVKEATASALQPYDLVIYGGGIMAGTIGAFKKFKELMNSLNGKKLIVFAVGLAGIEDEDAKQMVIKTNFTEEEKNNVPYFYFQGGLNYDKMGFFSKRILKMASSMTAKKADKTPEEAKMAESMQSSCDYTKIEYIEPLITYVKGL
ncbi:MAG: flavodoxin domain-containing protein [Mobilitalea sp.]